VFLDVPVGTPFDRTRALSEQVERAYVRLRDSLKARQPKNAQAPISGLETLVFEHWAGFWVELTPGARQRFSVEDLAQEWRGYVGDLGEGKLDFIYREGDSYYDLEWAVSAADSAAVDQAVKALVDNLADVPGVFDVNDSRKEGKPQRSLVLRPESRRLGLRVQDLAEQVSHAYIGREIQRFHRGSELVKVVARLPLEERRELQDLEQLPIQLPGGAQAPLNMLAEWRWLPKASTIERRDRQQVVWVRGRVNPEQADADAVYAALESGLIETLERKSPGLRITPGQSRQEQETALKTLSRNIFLAVAVIYALLAVSFQSYRQPFLFLIAVPVAWTGGVFAHWLADLPLSLESLVGMTAASGVVINDGLVLLHFVRSQSNDLQSASLSDRLHEACLNRFRPIFLTFATTFTGLLPLLFETSAQAQFLIPMALALASGLLFGMTATLILIPATVLALDRITVSKEDPLPVRTHNPG
jgi:multidrug efflux pump subunit AcrB